MKTIGLIGGMSWESSATYYRLTNQMVRERLGGNANARSAMLTVSFPEVVELQEGGDWETLGAMMQACARQLEVAGADCIVLCANTMHKVAPQIEQAVSIPLLHVLDAAAAALGAAGINKIALLGTRYVMEQPFYRECLQARGIAAVTPEAEDRAMVHRVIFGELTRGVISDASRDLYLDVIARMLSQGAEAVLLGCTELSMLLRTEDVPVPLFDTTVLHAQAAVDFALQSVVSNPGVAGS